MNDIERDKLDLEYEISEMVAIFEAKHDLKVDLISIRRDKNIYNFKVCGGNISTEGPEAIKIKITIGGAVKNDLCRNGFCNAGGNFGRGCHCQ